MHNVASVFSAVWVACGVWVTGCGSPSMTPASNTGGSDSTSDTSGANTTSDASATDATSDTRSLSEINRL